MSTNYVSSLGDTAAGIVTLVFTGEGYSTCAEAKDSLDIIYNPGPSVDAGNGQNICSDSPMISISGQVQIATGGVWTTSGSGSFIDSTSLFTDYIASSADTSFGSVTLYLTTTGNDDCPAAIDSLEVNFAPMPFANAGLDDAVCSTNPNYVLNGTYNVATGAYWTTSGTGSFTDTLDLNTTYFPTPADTVVGSVYLILTTTGNGICPAFADSMELTFTPDRISVFAGNDSTICADSVLLNGAVSIATGGIWSTNGTGLFNPSDSLLTPSYYFSDLDTAVGSVKLFLTSTGNGGCPPKVDSVTYTIQDPLLIESSVLDTLCAYSDLIPISVSVSTGSVLWSSLGDGTFDPSTNGLVTGYLPGSNDLSSGTTTLISTSQNNGACAAKTDTSFISFIQLPNADFSATQVCALSITQFTDLSTSSDGLTEWN